MGCYRVLSNTETHLQIKQIGERCDKALQGSPCLQGLEVLPNQRSGTWACNRVMTHSRVEIERWMPKRMPKHPPNACRQGPANLWSSERLKRGQKDGRKHFLAPCKEHPQIFKFGFGAHLIICVQTGWLRPMYNSFTCSLNYIFKGALLFISLRQGCKSMTKFSPAKGNHWGNLSPQLM